MRLQIPPQFLITPYDFDRHPQSASFDVHQGANCQLWAYALLEHFNVHIPPFRSSDLWEDRLYTEVVSKFSPLDLMLFHDIEQSWGAHVGVYIGDDHVAHLSRKNGVPAIESITRMLAEPKYKVFIGAKRAKKKQAYEGDGLA